MRKEPSVKGGGDKYNLVGRSIVKVAGCSSGGGNMGRERGGGG